MLGGRIIRFVIIAFFALLIGYGYFEGRGLLFGPSIRVSDQLIYSSEPTIAIEGTAQHIATLLLNGTPIPLTETGAFSETYALSPGYNRVTLDAKDKYGQSTSRVVEIVYTPTSTPQSAISSTTTHIDTSSTEATTSPEEAPQASL